MNFHKTNIALAITIGTYSAFGIPSAAHADILTGSYTDAGGSYSQSGGIINGASPIKFLTLGLNEDGAGFTGNVVQGIMAATASAGDSSNNNQGSGQSDIIYTTTFSNTGGTTQAFALKLNIGNSFVRAVAQNPYPNGAGTASAEISASVAVNGNNIWSSSATLGVTSSFATQYNPSYSFSTVGNAFSNGVLDTGCCGTNSETISFADYSGSVYFGALAPGQSDDISYELSSSAQLSNLSGGGFEDYGGSVAQIGDPFSINSDSIGIAAVPEPEVYATMAAGLALLGGLACRQKKR